jgi:hypothetical protein
MRALLIVWLALSVGLLAGHPAGARAAGCGETSCGVPSCWQPTIRERPGTTRKAFVQCSEVTAASVVTPPAHSQISNVTTDWSGFHFDARPDDDAPRLGDEVVFKLDGPGGSIEQHVSIEVVPLSENSAPVCDDARATQRSDGNGPVLVYLSPWCRDPDGDDFVIRGAGPGEHPQSPKTVDAGFSDSNWYYRTATFSGDESATIWATDSLGARSQDARLDVTVGPGVNRPPFCGWSNGVTSVYTRPGAVRRFGIVCSDLDGDPYTVRLSRPPERGAMSVFDVGAPSYGSADRWVDATYVPADDGLDPDPFAVTPTSADGDAAPAEMEMVPRALPENGGGSCGWSGANLTVDVPGELWMMCSDDDGDPLSAEVATQPKHGTLAPAVITPDRYGSSKITIPYVPDPGYEGYDCVTVKITDGNGLTFNLPFDIWVRAAPRPIAQPPLPPVTQLPPIPSVPSLPGGGNEPAALPVRELVKQALGTVSVRRLGVIGGAQVWARATLSRRDLVQLGSAPGLVVVCSKRCQIRSESRLMTGLRAVHSTGRKAALVSTPGQPQVLSLAASRAERRALRRARRPKARFTLRISGAGARPGSVTRLMQVSR